MKLLLLLQLHKPIYFVNIIDIKIPIQKTAYKNVRTQLLQQSMKITRTHTLGVGDEQAHQQESLSS